MRIAQVMEWNFSEPGGVQSHVMGLCTHLMDSGNYVLVIAKKRVKEGNDYPFSVYYIKPPFHSLSILFPVKSGDISRILRQEKIDLVHIHHIFTPVSISAANAAVKSHIPFVFTNHTIPYLSSKKSLLNLLVIHKNVLNKASKIISVSRSADKILDTLVKDKNKRIVIPNGVDASLFNPGNIKNIPHSICFVGRLVPRKGVQILIEAFFQLKREIKDAKLFIIGDGRYKSHLVSLVKRKKIQDVKFTGYLPPEKITKYYQSCEVVVVPSLERESFGIVALEGMACAKPVIVSDVGGLAEIIENGNDGIVIKRGDTEALSNAILDLFNNPLLSRRMGGNARKKVEKMYDWKPVTKKIIKVYNSLTQ